MPDIFVDAAGPEFIDSAGPSGGDGWTPTEYGFKVRNVVTLDTGKPALQREDGSIYYGPEQGNTGEPGWFNEKGERVSERGFLGSLASAAGYGLKKSVLGAAQAATEQQQSMGGYVSGAGGFPMFHPTPEGTDMAGAAKQATETASAAKQQFQRETGGGFIPTVVSEIADPANYLGAVGGAGAARTVGGKLVTAGAKPMLARAAASMVGGAVSAAPAAVLRPMDPGQSRPIEAAKEITGAGLMGAVLEPVAMGVSSVVRKASPGVKRLLQRVGLMAEEVPTVQAAVPDVPAVAPETVPMPEAPVIPTMEAQQEVGDVARQATRHVGGGQAKQDLAAMAQIDPQALASAEAVGIELPVDVFSQNPQVRSLAGLTRSQPASEAKAAWETSLAGAARRADELMGELGAQTSGGFVSSPKASDQVRMGLQEIIGDLDSASAPLFQAVSDSIPPASPVDMSKTRDLIKETLFDVGGNVSSLSKAEKETLSILKGETTYDSLNRLRESIGHEISAPKSFNSASDRRLKAIYGALADDQREAAMRYGGQPLADTLDIANGVYSKKMEVQGAFSKAFGPTGQGSIAPLLEQAITEKGNNAFGKLKELLAPLPESQKREAIATALSSVSRGKAAAGVENFGFTNFIKSYKALREKPEVYAEVVKILGPGSDELLRNIYSTTKKITEANGYLEPTGRALSGMVETLVRQGAVSRFARGAVTAGTATVGSLMGRGKPIMEAMTETLSKADPKVFPKLGKLLGSEEFRSAAIEAGKNPEVSAATLNRLRTSKTYQDWARLTGSPRGADAVEFLRNATRAGITDPNEKGQE